MMDQLIAAFPEQLISGLDTATTNEFSVEKEISSVLICGMGGSAAGGNFLKQFCRDELNIPVLVNKTYDLPNYVDPNTLVIVSSYSGNTEETLAAARSLEKLNALPVVVTSGGALAEWAKENNYPLFLLPAGYDSPRACLGFSLANQMTILQKAGLMGGELIQQLRGAAQMLLDESETIRAKAERLAGFIGHRYVLLYGADHSEAELIRWKQQLCENAKHLAWYNLFPEMNHNELVGWKGQKDDCMVLMLRHRSDAPRIQLRMDICSEIFQQYAGGYIEIISRGANQLERSLYFVHFGDWVSYYLAQIKGEDPNEVKVIDFLKQQISKH